MEDILSCQLTDMNVHPRRPLFILVQVMCSAMGSRRDRTRLEPGMGKFNNKAIFIYNKIEKKFVYLSKPGQKIFTCMGNNKTAGD